MRGGVVRNPSKKVGAWQGRCEEKIEGGVVTPKETMVRYKPISNILSALHIFVLISTNHNGWFFDL